MQCRLTRVVNGTGLRTNTVEGEVARAPEIGQSFVMTASPLEGGNLRVVNTSAIEKIEEVHEENTLVLTTESGSVYLLELYESDDAN